MKALDPITLDPNVMGGQPCLRGLRVTAGTIAGLVATGHGPAEILKLYPCLEAEDIHQAVEYCADWSDLLPTREVEQERLDHLDESQGAA